MSPAVEQIRQTVEARIRELQPVITELEQLEGILALLDEGTAVHQLPNISALLTGVQVDPPASGDMPPLESALSGRPPAAVEPLIRRGRRGTKPGRDGRAPQGANKQLIIATILQRPGISAPEIAQLTGLKRTVVSATINRLKRGGELEPHGRGVRVPLATPTAVA